MALALVSQIAGALAFTHGRGMVYGDLKPSNVIFQKTENRNPISEEKNPKLKETGGEGVSGFHVKLTDFGTSVVSAGLAAQTCPVSSRESAPLVSAVTHVRLLHGANTSMYMCGELRRGDRPEPHHDIYSLGVLWYQVLVGDVTREMHPGWAEELASECQTPKKHVEILQRCVGYFKRRPASAGELLPVLESLIQEEGKRPEVSFVSERLRKLDERFARAGRSSPESASMETEVFPKTEEAEDTLWGQETRVMGAGFVPQPGATSAQINRDAELARFKTMLNSQLANQAYDQARETLEVLLFLYPQDPEVQKAQNFLAQKQ
jgi:serine/threonine protein kinase